jgi:hypothetical protein
MRYRHRHDKYGTLAVCIGLSDPLAWRNADQAICQADLDFGVARPWLGEIFAE